MNAGREYEQERLAELIMFVANRVLGDPMFGAVKVNKALFYSDFEAYRRTGSSITGAVYQHLDQGPCAHQFLPALRSLGDDLKEVQRETPTGTRREFLPLRDSRVELFSGPEIAIVDEIVEWLRPLTAGQTSALSHETIAWRLTEDRDEVPYGAAVLSSDTPSEDDRVWLKEVARRGGLDAPTR